MGGEGYGLAVLGVLRSRGRGGIVSSTSWSPSGRGALVVAICKLGIFQLQTVGLFLISNRGI